MDACAGPLLRYRKQICAEHIAVWADVKKKHAAHAVTADVSLAETVKAAEFFGADAVIVTGTSFKGSSSTFTLTIQPQERVQFMTQCKAALNTIDGGSAMPAAGTKLDFSTRITST